MLILVPPSPPAPPSLTGWAFIVGRRTREGLLVAVAFPSSATPGPAPRRVEA